MTDRPINEREVVFFPYNGHNHDGENSSLVYIPPSAFQSGLSGAAGSGARPPQVLNGGTGTPNPDQNGLPNTLLSQLAPTNLVATPGVSGNNIFVDLTWLAPKNTAGVESITGYSISLSEDGFPQYYATSDIKYRANGLDANSTYTVYVVTQLSGGAQISDSSNTVTFSTGKDLTPPLTPTGVIASAGYKTVILSWTANTDAVMVNIGHGGQGSYSIDCATDSGFNTIVATQITSASVISFALTTFTQYWFRVYAVSKSGIFSTNPSSTVTATPGQPSNNIGDGVVPTTTIAGQPTTQGGPGWILVSWARINNPDIVSYDVFGGTVTGFVPDITNQTNFCGTCTESTSFFVKQIAGQNLVYNQDYYFKVYPRDADGYSSAGPSAASTAGQLVQVQNQDLSANSVTATQIVGGSITGDKIHGQTITGDNIIGGSITGGLIAGGTITGDNVLAGSITGTQIKFGTLTGDHIQANSVDASVIKVGTITADRLSALTIGVGKSIASQDFNANQGWFIGVDSGGVGHAFFRGGNSSITSAQLFGNFISTGTSSGADGTNHIVLDGNFYNGANRLRFYSGNSSESGHGSIRVDPGVNWLVLSAPGFFQPGGQSVAANVNLIGGQIVFGLMDNTIPSGSAISAGNMVMDAVNAGGGVYHHRLWFGNFGTSNNQDIVVAQQGTVILKGLGTGPTLQGRNGSDSGWATFQAGHIDLLSGGGSDGIISCAGVLINGQPISASGSGVTAFNGRGGNVNLLGSDVTNALGYTPSSYTYNTSAYFANVTFSNTGSGPQGPFLQGYDYQTIGLYQQGGGGTSGLGYLWCVSAFNPSSAGMKENINELSSVLDSVRETKIYSYKYKGYEDYHIGPMAEESPKEIVHYMDKNDPNTIGMGARDMVGYLWRAVQELADKVDKLAADH